MLQFDHKEYWQARYAVSAEPFEWYQDYVALAPVLQQHVSKADRVLHVGVGTSTVQESMAEDGYQHIVNVDYSGECIDLMQRHWDARSGCVSRRANACELSRRRLHGYSRG